MRLPAQLGCPVQVAVPRRGVAPIGQAAVIDARLTARLLERPIRRLLPRLARRGQPVPGLGRPTLARPALLWLLRVVPLEPLLGWPRDPVGAALGEHQVRVGILAVRAAAVDRQRIGQPLPGAHPLGKRARQRLPPACIQFTRQGKLDLAVEPPVGALMRVRRLPVDVRVVLRPRWHVTVLHMLAFLAVIGIAPLALDVLVLGAGGLPTGAGTETEPCLICRPATCLTVQGRPDGPGGHLSATSGPLSWSGPGGLPGGSERLDTPGRRRLSRAVLWSGLVSNKRGGACTWYVAT